MRDAIKDIRQELQDNLYHLAFLIGNGVNIYSIGNNDCSWDSILSEAWNGISGKTFNNKKGITLTEFYDILELKNSYKNASELKRAIVNPIVSMPHTPKHDTIQNYLEHWGQPVLTTNYDNNINYGLNKYILNHPLKRHYRAMSDYYPWDRYYSEKEIINPLSDFAVWHINGSLDYLRSIKLSFTEYMAQLAFTRTNFLHKQNEKNDYDNFETKDQAYWPGYNTWLHIFLNSSLCIIGLSLNEDETFLRWLLIERKKWIDRKGYKDLKGWYITTEKDRDMKQHGKRIFFEELGIKVVKLQNYADIYEGVLRKDYRQSIQF